MSSYRKMASVAFVVCMALLCSNSAALAALNDTVGKVVAVPNAPVTIQNCDLTSAYFDVSSTNRTMVGLKSFDVRFQAFNAGGKIIASATFTYPEALASGDADFQKQYNHGAMLPSEDIASLTCRLTTATFDGNKVWHFGEPWKGKLLPVATPTQ